jgi:hypothetical protein
VGGPLDRTWYNALVDDAGTGTTGTIWNKAQIANDLNSIDSSLAPLVAGPASAISGDVAIYSGTTGKLVSDSGVLASSLVTGPASAVSGDLVTFGDTTGKLVADSGLTMGAATVAVPFNAANFTVPTGTWTVTAAQVTSNGYYRIGHLVVWCLYIAAGSTLSAAPGYLMVALPLGTSLYDGASGFFVGGGTGPAIITTNVGANQAYLNFNNGTSNWPAGSLGTISFTMSYLI